MNILRTLFTKEQKLPSVLDEVRSKKTVVINVATTKSYFRVNVPISQDEMILVGDTAQIVERDSVKFRNITRVVRSIHPENPDMYQYWLEVE